ncbi:MAG TPA: glycosyltransferase family 2 protein [Candidatus Hydrogenedentes bacterium]|nr:glycosyltransferase family 2 protein [Candidatus Hydrogenedentota bacterium]HOS03362.1 glycosyltransferase family 2 protein [Candidatus Hydrogenedentota bacterium]
MSERPSVSIFFPYYNDWGTMGSMVLLAVRTAERLGLDYDLSIVDDGSRGPQNEAVLAEIGARFPGVRIVRHAVNRGYGGALRSGFAAATREWIFYTDGDAQYDVRELEALLERAGPEVDIVQGYKIVRHDPLHRIVIGRVYHYVVKIAFGLGVRDTDCDFRLIRRAALERIELVSDTGMICVEMMYKFRRAGWRFVEAPVHHFQRAHGKSQFFNFPRLFRTFVALARFWATHVLLGR